MSRLEDEIGAVIARHGLSSEPGTDTRTFEVLGGLHPGGTKFVEHGSRASDAAHEMADQIGTEITKVIDANLAPNEREITFCRLNVAYQLLAANGVEIDD